MSRRLWTGLLVGVLGAMALVAVGVGAFHAGQRHTAVTTVAPLPGATGETVRVIGYGHWGPWNGPPFGFLFPLLIIGLIALLIAGRRRAYWGPPASWGGACGPAGRQEMLTEWHERAHAESKEAPPGQA